MAEQRERHSRSDRTKLRILNAARRRFAEEGYERTTIRGVAAAAAIDPSMVIRYFGNKEGLFAAAASFDLALPDLAAVPRRERGKRLARHFLHLWEHDAAGGGLAVLLRTAATSDGAAERVRRIFREQVLPAIAAVSPDAPATRAALITSQFLGLAYSRYVVRIPELTMLAEDVIVASLGRTIQRYLDAPLV
ncbi:MAG TPA: TetR family transcriptional regulator [Stellaceae bacterium]|nr:TetR family transcriptional regulator [Stellaceae bacterium]